MDQGRIKVKFASVIINAWLLESKSKNNYDDDRVLALSFYVGGISYPSPWLFFFL